MSKPFPIWPQQLLLTGTSKQEQTHKQIIYLPLSDIIHAPYVNRILPHIVIWNAIPEIHKIIQLIRICLLIFVRKWNVTSVEKKIPTKQDLFNGEIIFSADTGLLSSNGARSSMKVSKVRVRNECGSPFYL